MNEPTNSPAIEVRNLERHFKIYHKRSGVAGAFRDLLSRKHSVVKALDGVSFQVETGEVLGYIGPNGAGKSTTIKICCGIVPATSGEVRVLGTDPHKNRQRLSAQYGVVFGQRTQLWWDLPVEDSFNILRHVYKIPKRQYEEALDEMVSFLDLKPLYGKPVRQLSLGQKTRCEIAAALLHRPKVLFLDEPTIGLDVSVKMQIRKFIKEMNQKWKMSVILTSHDLLDIEQLSNRVLVLDKGRLIYHGNIQDLRDHYGLGGKLTVDFDGDFEIPELQGVTVVEKTATRAHMLFDRKKWKAPVLISKLGGSVRDFSVEPAPIEDIVARIYTEKGAV